MNPVKLRSSYALFRIKVFGPGVDAPTHIFENGRKYVMSSGMMVGNDSVSIKYSLERNPNAARK